MDPNNITHWIRRSIESSSSRWLVLTLRIDGTLVPNGSGTAQSPWNPSLTGGQSKVKTALGWAVTMLRRKMKYEIRFGGYFGGDFAKSVRPHIHAICEVPRSSTTKDMVQSLRMYWQQSVERKFKCYLPTSVYQEKVESTEAYLRYISRWEGKMFGYGDSKLILNRSFLF